jgi:serine protease
MGTSMAAPHIAGLVALMVSENATLTPAQVLSALQSHARPIPGTCRGGCGAAWPTRWDSAILDRDREFSDD